MWSAAFRAYHDPRYAWVSNHVREKDPVDDPLDLMFMPPDMPAGELEVAEDTVVKQRGRHIHWCTLFPNGGFPAAGLSGVTELTGLAKGLLGVRITRGNGTVDLVISADTAGTCTVAGQTFKGQLALLRVANGATAVVDVGE